MASGPTYESYSTVTVSADTSSVTFSNISGSFTDLVVIGTFKFDTGGNLRLRYNNDAGSTSYIDLSIYQDETGNQEFTEGQTSSHIRAGNWSTTLTGDVSVTRIDIQNYANTATYKPCYVRWASTDYHLIRIGMWKSTNAITSITFSPDSGNIKSGSKFTIYGITAA